MTWQVRILEVDDDEKKRESLDGSFVGSGLGQTLVYKIYQVYRGTTTQQARKFKKGQAKKIS